MTRDGIRVNSDLQKRAHLTFALFLLASTALWFGTWRTLFALGLHDDSYSQVIFIPFVSLFFLFTERDRFVPYIRPSISVGAAIIAAAVIIFWGGKGNLSLEMLAVVLTWVGAFVAAYGLDALRKASFPLLLLLLMIPPPAQAIEWVIHQLQAGSADVSYALFNLLGVPVMQRGFILALPGVTIEVAAECSGIRSSIAMLITCLLAAHIYLRTFWKSALFVLLVIPLVVIKNGIRIATLTMLAVKVDPSFLTGRLHHEGGIVFFLIALFLMLPILLALEKSERRPAGTVASSTPVRASNAT